MMDETTMKMVAAQLRKPEGAAGIETGLQMNRSNRHMNLYTIEALALAANDRILEIGMGNGEFIPQIVNVHSSIRYSASDYSQTMIDEAIRRNQNAVATGQAEFFLSTADFLPFEDNTFDKAFGVNTLYFWEPAAELRELRRVLKPNGKLVMTIRPKEIMHHFPFTQYGFTLYSGDDMAKALTDAGYTVNEVIVKQEPEMPIEDRLVSYQTVLAIAQANK